ANDSFMDLFYPPQSISMKSTHNYNNLNNEKNLFNNNDNHNNNNSLHQNTMHYLRSIRRKRRKLIRQGSFKSLTNYSMYNLHKTTNYDRFERSVSYQPTKFTSGNNNNHDDSTNLHFTFHSSHSSLSTSWSSINSNGNVENVKQKSGPTELFMTETPIYQYEYIKSMENIYFPFCANDTQTGENI
ncbi:unnamed protein product, partial [Schistosoma turkestanicum]